MLVLHAGFYKRRMILWGESSTPATESKKRTSGNRPYLHAAGYKLLAQALEKAEVALLPSNSDEFKAAVWLPTASGQPIPSSSLITSPVLEGDLPKLSPWLVPAVRLTAKQTLQFLCACANKDLLEPGIVIGKSIAYWANAMRFAGAITARQQFLPTLVSEFDARGAWEPFFDEEENLRFQKLSEVMPESCRCVGTLVSDVPDTPRHEVLHAFLTEVIDYLVRLPGRICQRGVVPSRSSRQETLHDAWLSSLHSPIATLDRTAQDIDQLVQQLDEWKRPLNHLTRTPFRLCFRLEEPREAEDPFEKPAWHVNYFLQDGDDPDFLIPVQEVLQGEDLSLFQRKNFNAPQYLLSALWKAAEISPEVEESLKTEAPSGFPLSNKGAHRFLSETAWQLQRAGFGVVLPAWWEGQQTQSRLTLHAHVHSNETRNPSGFSLDDLLKVNWNIVLGNDTIPTEELQALAKSGNPLIKIRNRWISSSNLKATLDFLDQKNNTSLSSRDAVQIAFGFQKTTADVEFAGLTASGWFHDLLTQLNGNVNFEELPQPERFEGTLRPYQLRGYSWLHFLRQWGLGACLADDMGLGKTIQILALIQSDWNSGFRKPILLICPTSVVGNWKKEAARFTPDLPVMIHHGYDRRKGSAFEAEAQKHAIIISSYALLHRDVELLKTIHWGGVVLDEAQNIKNPDTKQSRASRLLTADYRAALTGTPVENNVGDLWSIMDFLNQNLLGKQSEFKRNFFIPIQTNSDPEAANRLRKLTQPFVLRRVKTDKSVIADLPEKMEMKVFCNLTKEQASLYATLVQETTRALDATEGIQRKGLILTTLIKLKQICNHPAHFLQDDSALVGRSGKLTRLTEMLEEIFALGERALIFTQFRIMGNLIQQHLQDTFGEEALFLHGELDQKTRDRMVERFQTDPNAPSIFIASLKAGGTGLNLTRANHVFHFDRWWNPAVENQATDRAFRIGQTRNVQVHKFLCTGTLEDKIDEMIERKRGLAENIIGTGENWLTELSTSELKELFSLNEEAVAE